MNDPFIQIEKLTELINYLYQVPVVEEHGQGFVSPDEKELTLAKLRERRVSLIGKEMNNTVRMFEKSFGMTPGESRQ